MKIQGVFDIYSGYKSGFFYQKRGGDFSLPPSCLPVPMLFNYQVLSCFWYLVWNIFYQFFHRAI